jgi:2-acylglycerol O-acyltransferase 2
VKVQQDRIAAKDIDEVHERYMRELEHMWDEWKDEFAPNRREELTLL